MSETTAGAIAYLAAAFPRTPIAEATVAVYVEQLSDIPPNRLLVAARLLVAHANFFPTVAELRHAAFGSGGRDLPASWEAIAQAQDRSAWEERHHNWNTSPSDHRTKEQACGPEPRLHPIVQRAYDAVGFDDYKRRIFEECYLDLCERQERNAALGSADEPPLLDSAL